MNKPLLLIVGADKGGVGKTTVSRAILDYLQTLNVKYNAWDTEYPAGILNRFYPTTSKIVDLTKSAGQMDVLDNLTTNAVTVVDVRAGLLSPTLKMFADVGLLQMVQNQQATLAIAHILGPTLASIKEIESTSKIIGGASHFLIKNHVNNTTFFDWDPSAYEKAFKDVRSGLLDVGHLDELAAEHVESEGVTFTDFIDNKTPQRTDAKYSFVLRGYVRHWLTNTFAEFDRVKLNDLVKSGIG